MISKKLTLAFISLPDELRQSLIYKIVAIIPSNVSRAGLLNTSPLATAQESPLHAAALPTRHFSFYTPLFHMF